MSDLPPLGLPRRPGSAPRPEVLDAVVRAGRRRLRRAALGATSVVALVVAGVAGGSLMGGDSGGSVVLVPASPAPDGGLEPTAEGSRPPSLRPVTPSAEGRPQAMSPGPLQPGRDEPTSTPGPGRTPGATPRPGATPYRESPGRSTGSTSCDVNDVITGTPPGTQVCAMATMQRSTTAYGEAFEVEMQLCNSISSSQAYAAEFPSGREHDLRAEYGDSPVWTWSRAYSFPEGEHVREVDPGYCLVWVTTWDTRDDDGQFVDPGVYYLEAEILISDDPREFSIRADVSPRPTPSPSPTEL